MRVYDRLREDLADVARLVYRMYQSAVRERLRRALEAYARNQARTMYWMQRRLLASLQTFNQGWFVSPNYLPGGMVMGVTADGGYNNMLNWLSSDWLGTYVIEDPPRTYGPGF